jgi:hypothetical protein
MCLCGVLGDQDTAVRTLFRTRGEEGRILVADALMRGRYQAAGLGPAFSEAIADMGYCRQIRNQFAHCHWYDSESTGLAFVQLENTAKGHAPVTLDFRSIGAGILMRQEKYFVYVRNCLFYLQGAFA